jgi:hypothetical protein
MWQQRQQQAPEASSGMRQAAPGAGTRGQQWHAASSSMQLFITIELAPPSLQG